MDINQIRGILAPVASQVDYWSLRLVDRLEEDSCVRQGVFDPFQQRFEQGVMLTVYADGGAAYVASGDLSAESLKKMFALAVKSAKMYAKKMVFPMSPKIADPVVGRYQSEGYNKADPDRRLIREQLDSLAKSLKSDHRIVDWQAAFGLYNEQTSFVCSLGSEVQQSKKILYPRLSVTAFDRGTAQSRSFAGGAWCRQGELGDFEFRHLQEQASEISEEALALLYADNCPDESLDLLLAPDQMVLQIHESIGHPLELDRILGDERNYAGRSFVSPDMFGRYQYGSELLNVVFDPSEPGELATYKFDDEATPAQKTYLIKAGILQAGLGGRLSQARSELPGVACSRATNWNRPAIDRMANINIEAGSSSLNEMIGRVERGLYMKTNTSWSIDDSRNKFQFGCEWGQMIENGKLTKLVRKPNYRGVSAKFWRSLIAVGDLASRDVLGTPFCGKGEPNQVIAVGHASPACLFSNIDVFGGS